MDADVVSEEDMRRFVMAYNSSMQPVTLPVLPVLPAAQVPVPIAPKPGMSRQKLAVLALVGLIGAILLATVVCLCSKRTKAAPTL